MALTLWAHGSVGGKRGEGEGEGVAPVFAFTDQMGEGEGVVEEGEAWLGVG